MYIFDFFFLCEERIFLCLKDGKRAKNRENKIRLKERKALYSFVYTSVLKQRTPIILRWGLMNMHSFRHWQRIILFIFWRWSANFPHLTGCLRFSTDRRRWLGFTRDIDLPCWVIHTCHVASNLEANNGQRLWCFHSMHDNIPCCAMHGTYQMETSHHFLA